MRRTLNSWLILAFMAAAGLPHGAKAQTPGNNCANTHITEIKMPVGPAKVDSGRITLANGATLQLTGTPHSRDMRAVSKMQVGNPVHACYGPLRSYADAPPSRALTIIDRTTGQLVGGPIGTWPGKMHR